MYNHFGRRGTRRIAAEQCIASRGNESWTVWAQEGMMAREGSGSRKQAEDRFAKARRTTVVAQQQIEAERKAVRAKTARLKAERLAKEAAEAASAAEKPKPSKRVRKS